MTWHVRVRLRLGALDLDVDIEGSNAPLALVGPNGAGKTTLLRTIAGAHRPTAGSIQVGDRTLFDSVRSVDLPPEARQVGYVPQGFGLFPHLRVVDNVAFGLLADTPRRARDDRRRDAGAMLERLECGQLAERWPAALSGGEKQRVALARALMIQPEILLLDEPLAALDVSARRALRSHLASHLASRSAPAIVVTHDVRDVRALGAMVVVLEEGRIVQRGSVEALSAQPQTDFVAEFFHADFIQEGQG